MVDLPCANGCVLTAQLAASPFRPPLGTFGFIRHRPEKVGELQAQADIFESSWSQGSVHRMER